MVHPALCTKALRALLDILQGQQPEGLKSEPNDVIGKNLINSLLKFTNKTKFDFLPDPLFDLLLDLATSHGPDAILEENIQLSAVACSCLLALVVARGDTGKLLSATSALLMSPKSLSAQSINVRMCLLENSKSISLKCNVYL